MAIYLGLGSNQGDRKDNLETAINHLVAAGFKVSRVSPLVESPALLPDNAESSWNRPFLNCVLEGQADWSPQLGLENAKAIEAKMGRTPSQRWAPRPIDIDLLLWHEQIVNDSNLTIPHPGIPERAFVLSPLHHLQADMIIPGMACRVGELCGPPNIIPLWMGVLNITPDSFSDGGVLNEIDKLGAHVDLLLAENVHILDVGAESTRPRAEKIIPIKEWDRLQPALECINEKSAGSMIRPLISVDSRNATTLEKALGFGVDMINDVSGLSDPDICDLVKQSGCQVIAMHSVTVPADPNHLLPTDRAAVDQLKAWLDTKIESWEKRGLDLNKIIFDPGIGFGKSALQSMELLQHCEEFRKSGLRLLIGHSRKSFMNTFASSNFNDRDMETLGISMSLCQQGVDIIRIHDPVSHIRAYRGWSHVQHQQSSA